MHAAASHYLLLWKTGGLLTNTTDLSRANSSRLERRIQASLGQFGPSRI